MSRWRLIWESLTYHGRTQMAVGLGVMAATAVLTGALVVGDSVRGSLRAMALDRLGRIDQALLGQRFFREELGNQLAAGQGFADRFDGVVPAVILPGTVERPADSSAANQLASRAGNVTILGCDTRFWALGKGGPDEPPRADEVVINQTLADELHARPGDDIIVRLGRQSDIPADSPLGRKTGLVRSRRLTVRQVLAGRGLGRFGLRPNQQLPRNAFVALKTAQAMLDKPGRVNTLLVAGKTLDATAPRSAAALQTLLRPTLDDYGLSLKPTDHGEVQLTAERMLLEPRVEQAALRAFAGLRHRVVFTYLANTIASGGREIPYSTITAADFAVEPPWGPLRTPAGKAIGPLADDEIILNQWAADALEVRPGATIEITYFEPQSTHGEIIESTASFRLKAVAAIRGAAADRELTPEMRGVTDQLSMADWDPPFPFDGTRITDRDEAYWDQYGATPKAFVSLARGAALWNSRFGDATSIQIVPDTPGDAAVAALRDRLKRNLNPASLGFVFRPVKRLALAASSGTTSFDGLFLGFSFFIIASALMLIVLLFRLSIEQRSGEIGILTAVGLRRRQIRGLLSREGLAVAALGSVVGVGAGVFYGWIMLAGLSTWWLEAITTPFLRLYVNPVTMLVGYVAGVVVSLAAMVWSLWRAGGSSVRNLLAGRVTDDRWPVHRQRRLAAWLGWGAIAAAIALAAVAPRLGGEAQAGAFFGSGALVLCGMLALVWARFSAASTASIAAVRRGALWRLALRNAARNPGRSSLTIGLVAAASFLIVAISAFRLEPPESSTRRDTGTGGYSLLAESAVPIYHDLNQSRSLAELGMSADEIRRLRDVHIAPLRVRPGDDASCLNLYQPRQPQVLGVSAAVIQQGGFEWADSAAADNPQRRNPWLLLERDLGRTDDHRPVVPVVLDLNTAMYSLHLWQGVGSRYELADGHGGKITLEIVGLLANSIFQGQLLISETWFERLFPELSGYRFFLIDAPPATAAAVSGVLETSLGDTGFDVVRTTARLASFFAVQNTYLSTFQSLGGLGLLLGTFGLATVELRNVFERRGELALLRATGFRRRRLGELVMLENGVLLTGGLAIGIFAALVAVGPHWFTGGASIPWQSLVAMLAAVLLVGMVVGAWAVRTMLRAPLLSALRGE